MSAIKTANSKKSEKLLLKIRSIFQMGLTVLISVLIIFTVVKAGTITPPSGGGEPSAKFYTISEIYTRLTTNAAATEGSHDFTFSDSLASTGRTLTEIYNAIPTIVANTVKLGTSYLGVAGTLVPSGGTAAPADTCNGLTFYGAAQADWNLQTGSLNPAAGTILNGTTICGVAGTVIPNPAYGDNNAAQVLNTASNPGTYDVATCTSSYNTLNLSVGTVKTGTTFGNGLTGEYPSASYPLSGAIGIDAAAGDIRNGLDAWNKTGAHITGTMPAQTLSAASETVSAGYYDAATLSAVDADLAVGNIKSGTTIFGILGTLVAYLFGDNDASKVLTTAATAGTYNAANLSTATVKKGTVFDVSSTGAYSGYPGTGWTGTVITQAACDAQNPTWYWFEDGNGDGDTTDPEDGVCVRASTVTSLSWNGSEQIGSTPITAQAATGGSANSIIKTGAVWTANAYADMVVKITAGTAINCWGIVKSNTADTINVYGSWLSSAYASNCGTPDATSVFAVEDDGFALYDNSWIGDWTCTGSFPNGAPSWGSYPTSAQVGAGAIALASADCYDGTRDLLPTEASRAVRTGTATATSTTSITDSSLSLDANAWVGQKVLITGGTGYGGYGRIESNTATAITVDSWTGGDPDVGSTFAIVYLIPHATYNPNTDVDGNDDDQLNGNNGPLTQEVLNNWKGTKLPTASDFFGFCGYKDGGSNYESTTGTSTADKTYGNYGGQIGRTDEFLDLANSGSWEWLSEQHNYSSARIAGNYACSYFTYSYVYYSYRFRAVFRP
ncbi:MAG: hypothetical protein PHG00_18215 [Methylococcales bacterium]|nr:hypothetical protein [Methylococcales bacterium]